MTIEKAQKYRIFVSFENLCHVEMLLLLFFFFLKTLRQSATDSFRLKFSAKFTDFRYRAFEPFLFGK